MTKAPVTRASTWSITKSEKAVLTPQKIVTTSKDTSIEKKKGSRRRLQVQKETDEEETESDEASKQKVVKKKKGKFSTDIMCDNIRHNADLKGFKKIHYD